MYFLRQQISGVSSLRELNDGRSKQIIILFTVKFSNFNGLFHFYGFIRRELLNNYSAQKANWLGFYVFV